MATITTPSTAPPLGPSPAPRGKALVGIGLLVLMIVPMIVKFLTGTAFPHNVETFKAFVDAMSVPEISLPFFFLPLFIGMLVFYREWTQPKVAIALLLIFCLFYFGSMAIDPDYLSILEKADNVPITMMLLGAMICLWTAFRQASLNDAAIEAGMPMVGADKEDKTLVWPDLVYTELICLVVATAILVIWSVVLRAPLEAPANPAGPPNPSKAPWYFLGLQEMLVYFDPWMAGVLLPGLIVVGLIAMPFIDTNPKGNGYYTLRQRPFAIAVWLFGFLILWVVLIVFGTFLRGPNWNFFGPYQYWDAHKQVALTNINLSEYWYVYLWRQPVPTHPIHREWLGILFTFLWIFVAPPILAHTVMNRLYRQMGPGRFYVMAVLFMFMAMLPLKMVLRWLFVLKYFVYLPEYNLNL
jgi:hypothetical protein